MKEQVPELKNNLRGRLLAQEGSALGELSVVLTCTGIMVGSNGLIVLGVLITGGVMAGRYIRRYIIRRTHQGFTLIELSIVLVVIGLIIGGVLVGQDLIHAAAVRATITQVERYQTATNTFRGKFGFLPGDINAAAAATFGFVSRGQYRGEGDGNGFVEGVTADGPNGGGPYQNGGETCMFWVDLGTAGLIDSALSSCSPNTFSIPYTLANINLFLPAAKIGGGNNFYVWSYDNGGVQGQGSNWFGLSSGQPGGASSTVGLRVVDAYNIDKKIDDGLPYSGNVTVMYITSSYTPLWSGVAFGNINTSATPGSSTTCFDNGNGAGAPQQYSLDQADGAYVNCGLSFRFQ